MPVLKIGLNLLQARPAIGGGWKYIASIVETLARFDRENEYIAYCNPSSKSIVPESDNFSAVEAASVGTNQLVRLAYENTWLQFRAKLDRLDVMHWFGNTQSLLSLVPAVVTVHDLRSFESLRQYNPARMLHARVMIPWTVRRARFLLPVSSYTASGLQSRFSVPRERLAVIPYPLGDEWQRAGSEAIGALRARYGLPEKFWLYVAHAYPHKNHRSLFAAYSKLLAEDRETWPLVLRGDNRGDIDLTELAVRYGIADRVTRLPQLAADEMPALYSAATALVFPSSFEGFGMPLVEALACGCPAVASAIPTTMELAGDRVLTCDPADPDSIARAMMLFQRDPDLLAAYADRGAGCREGFHPQTVFRSLLQCYSETARHRGQAVTRSRYARPSSDSPRKYS